MNMIDEAKEKRKKLEASIQKLMVDFQEDTCLRVTEINVTGKEDAVNDTLRVKVDLPRYMSREYLDEKHERIMKQYRELQPKGKK